MYIFIDVAAICSQMLENHDLDVYKSNYSIIKKCTCLDVEFSTIN